MKLILTIFEQMVGLKINLKKVKSFAMGKQKNLRMNTFNSLVVMPENTPFDI
jgi:hypothetical protein